MIFSSNKQTKDRLNNLSDQFTQFLHIGNEFDPRKEALRIAGIYTFIGGLWILLSDEVLNRLIHDKELLTRIGQVKGWFYVLITGLLIYGLIWTALKRIKQDGIKIDQSYRDLSATYEELEATYEELTASEEELRQQYEVLMDHQKNLSESEERYRLISEASNDGIWDELYGVRYFSDRWLEITGYTRDELNQIGDWNKLIHPEDYDMAVACLEEHLKKKTNVFHSEYRLRNKQGEYIWIQARGKALFDEKGNFYRMAGSHADITALKEYQERLHHIAYHDSLTNLKNRLSLLEDNPELFSINGVGFGLFIIDVDNFKLMNDTLGHTFGDQLLVLISRRIEALICEECSLYRLGGDEFVVITNNHSGKEEVLLLASRILESFKEPFLLCDSILHISVSIGISIYPEHGGDMNELLRCADIAMFKAKEAGRSRCLIYHTTMNEMIRERMLVEKNLRKALEFNEFLLFYQPQVDVTDNCIIGFEALLRWNNPELGAVSPLKFIKVAEDTHIIIPLGTWVLREACSFMKKLQNQGAANVTISVNISILQIVQKNFVDLVMDTLAEYQVPPQNLELEITETILIESYDAVVDKLRLLYQKGIKIALDDFGKGYSSLSYLKQLPITTLKIDKSFIDCITTDERSKILTGQIVTLARSMGLNVVAEGVELTEQLDYLTESQTPIIQGYLFSKPVPEGEAITLLGRESSWIKDLTIKDC